MHTCDSVPLRTSVTSASMPPASAIATWLSALPARNRSAPAAFSFCASVPPGAASATSASMPPARAMATWLPAEIRRGRLRSGSSKGGRGGQEG